MRTITTNIYEFSELPEQVKEIAIRKYYEDHEPLCNSEYENTLSAIGDIFGIKISGYAVNDFYYRYSFSAGDNFPDVKGMYRLPKYINNQVMKKINDTKYPELGLTGIYSDYGFMDAIIRCGKYIDLYGTWRELIDAALNKFFWAWQSDIEEERTAEAFGDFCLCNGYEFYEDGEMV